MSKITATIYIVGGIWAACIPLDAIGDIVAGRYSSGEDPYLGAQMIAPAVVGVQQNGVITCVKHYIMSTPPGPMLSLSLAAILSQSFQA